VFTLLEKPDAKVDILKVGCVVTLNCRFRSELTFQNFYTEFMTMLKELSVFVILKKPDVKVDILKVGYVVSLPIRFCGDQIFQNFYKEFMKVREEFFVCVF